MYMQNLLLFIFYTFINLNKILKQFMPAKYLSQYIIY